MLGLVVIHNPFPHPTIKIHHHEIPPFSSWGKLPARATIEMEELLKRQLPVDAADSAGWTSGPPGRHLS